MDLGLAGKTAIVTGGASNIGRTIVFTLLQEGANVVIADWDDAQAGKVLKEATRLSDKVVSVAADVTSLASTGDMVKKALQAFGSVDILVNSAGWGRNALFVDMPQEEWDKVISINYRGVLNSCRAVLDTMIEKKYGRIVSLSSDAARMGEYKESVYAGAKAAISAFSGSLAREVGRFGIAVNVVCPGLTKPVSNDVIGEKSLWKDVHDFTPEQLEKTVKSYPLRRLGTAQDVANAVAFLASERAGFITGQVLSVSGGYTINL